MPFPPLEMPLVSRLLVAEPCVASSNEVVAIKLTSSWRIKPRHPHSHRHLEKILMKVARQHLPCDGFRLLTTGSA